MGSKARPRSWSMISAAVPERTSASIQIFISSSLHFTMLSLSFVDFITILVIAPGAVSVQVGQQMITRVFEFRAVESQAYQPHPEGKQLIVAVCFLHDRAALVDCLCRHGEA